MARRNISDAAERMLTGSEALAEVTGGSPTPIRDTPPKKRSESRAKAPPTKAKATKSKQTDVASDERLIQTTVTIAKGQWDELRTIAFHKSLKEGGKADASALVRDIVEQWLNKRRVGVTPLASGE